MTVDLSRTADKAPDGEADIVVANGSNGRDNVSVVATGNGFKVLGLGADLKVTHIDKGMDGVTLKGLGGKDTLDAVRPPQEPCQCHLGRRERQGHADWQQGNGHTFTAAMARTLIDGGKGNDDIFGDVGNDKDLLATTVPT